MAENTTTNATTNNKPLSITEIMKRKLPAIVTPGKYEDVEIKSTELYPVSQTNKQEFLRITYKTADGREISENRFPQGLNILISHLREQLKLQETEIDVAELLKPGAHKFTIWVERTTTINNSGALIRVTNINFLEPLQKSSTATETTAAEAAASDPAAAHAAGETANVVGDPLPTDPF